jgi:hypothetical protein
MPDQPAGGERIEPTEAVKAHLKKSNVRADQIHGKVIKALNEFTAVELEAMYNDVDKKGLAAALKQAYPASTSIIGAVH